MHLQLLSTKARSQKNLGCCTCRKILDQILEQKVLDYFPRVRFCKRIVLVRLEVDDKEEARWDTVEDEDVNRCC